MMKTGDRNYYLFIFFEKRNRKQNQGKERRKEGRRERKLLVWEDIERERERELADEQTEAGEWKVWVDFTLPNGESLDLREREREKGTQI